MAETKPRLYKTEMSPERRLRVSYPSGNGSLLLRTEQDWDKDVELIAERRRHHLDVRTGSGPAGRRLQALPDERRRTALVCGPN